MTQPARSKHSRAARQAELVQAALQLSAQQSPAEITTADLAQVIGITQGGVFKHFENKEAIWLAVLDWAQQTLLHRLRQAAEQHVAQNDPQRALRAMFMTHVEFVLQYPGVPRLIFQELQHARISPLKDKVQLLMRDYRQLLADLLMRLRRTGRLAPDADMQAAAVLFIGAVQGLVMQALINGNLAGMSAQARTVYDIFEAGLLANTEPEPRRVT